MSKSLSHFEFIYLCVWCERECSYFIDLHAAVLLSHMGCGSGKERERWRDSWMDGGVDEWMEGGWEGGKESGSL